MKRRCRNESLRRKRSFRNRAGQGHVAHRRRMQFEVLEDRRMLAISDGLIAHYTFDGDAHDSSGNGNDATVYNNYEYVSGVSNEAIRLVGQGHTGLSGGHVILPSLSFPDMPEFTIALWVNHQGNTSSHGENFISFGNAEYEDRVGINYEPGAAIGFYCCAPV